MADVTLTPDVRGVLERAEIEGSVIRLTENLDRSLYQNVDKALRAAGGKWNRKERGHVFNGDPRVKLGLMLETGVAVDEKKALQAFFTPPQLANFLVDIADVECQSVLEPSAGTGNLAKECILGGATRVRCIELSPEYCEELRRLSFDTTEADFLTVEPDDELFDKVVMNPPFTRNQDVKHVEHALKFLKPGGKLVSVMAGNTDRAPFQRLVEGRLHTVIELPEGSFKESGTNVNTIVLEIRT